VEAVGAFAEDEQGEIELGEGGDGGGAEHLPLGRDFSLAGGGTHFFDGRCKEV
jgi:hypothetical protein